MKKITPEIYFTPKQAADYFNLSLSTVKNYIYAGKLRTLKTPGGHHRISKAAILTALGEVPFNSEDMRDNLRYNLCKAILNLFKVFGSHADYFISHGKNVSRLAGITAKAIGMSALDISLVEISGLVHDIGLVGIEKHIALKKSALTPEEYETIKTHCAIGAEMLDSISELLGVSDIVMQHHERVDGAGYPGGLESKKIKEHAKIVSVAEAYDTMVSQSFYPSPESPVSEGGDECGWLGIRSSEPRNKRCHDCKAVELHKTHFSKERALEELVKNSSRQFDGEIVRIFIKVI